MIIPASYTESEYSLAAGVKHADASARTKPITLNGNEKGNSLFGGAGNDTLNGYGGGDSLKGGAGNDVFIYTGGEDLIVDYSAKGDKVSLASSIESDYKDFAVKDGDLIIGYGENNSLTIVGGGGQEISFLKDNKATAYIYTDKGIFDTKKTSLVLASSLSSYDASKESALLTISASAVTATGGINITGNDKNNLIIAGSTSATLNGKDGNDTLVGGASKDTFVYEKGTKAGNDMVSLYGAGDVISLVNGGIDDVTFNKTNDVVFKIDKNTITVKDAAISSLKTIQFAGEDSRTFSIVSATEGVFVDDETNPTTVSLPATFANAYTVKGGVSHVDASALTKLITLTGDDNANSLFGGKGNDTIIGLKGNDTFKGGAGKRR